MYYVLGSVVIVERPSSLVVSCVRCVVSTDCGLSGMLYYTTELVCGASDSEMYVGLNVCCDFAVSLLSDEAD